MIQSVTVTNHLGRSLTLELPYPEKSGLVVQEITGLSPCKADISMTELSGSDGAIYNSARVTSRNIVFQLKPLFSPTIEEMRLVSYQFFPIKKWVKLLFQTEQRLCETYGYVETNEANIFSKDVTIQISIFCPDPYFYSAGDGGITTTVFYGVESLFEFPFENDDTVENTIEMGDIKDEREQIIYYAGDASVGMIITVQILGEISDLIIHNVSKRTSMRISAQRIIETTGTQFGQGDEITISTIKGNKYITLFREGEHYNILNCLDKNADWFQLETGDNLFAYTTEYGMEHLKFVIENRTVYEGV